MTKSRQLTIWGAASLAYSINVFGLSHIVQRRETLSGIALQYIGAPVYGRDGSLSKILKLNASIKNQNLVFPDQEIVVSLEEKYLDHEAEQALTPTPEPSHPSPPRAHGIGSVTTDFFVSKISARDKIYEGRARLFSKYNRGLTLRYSQILTKNISSELFFSYRKASFFAPASTVLLSNSNPTLYSFGATAKFSPLGRWTFKLSLKNQSELFLLGFSPVEIGFQALSTFTLSSSVLYDFFIIDPFVFGTALESGFSLPKNSGSIKSHLNPSHIATMYVRYTMSQRTQIDSGLITQYKLQDTNLADQNQLDFGIYLSLLRSF